MSFTRENVAGLHSVGRVPEESWRRSGGKKKYGFC